MMGIIETLWKNPMRNVPVAFLFAMFAIVRLTAQNLPADQQKIIAAARAHYYNLDNFGFQSA
jgi:hypothetical protein